METYKKFFQGKKVALGILVAVGAALVFGLYPPATRGAYADGANAVFIILFTTFFRMASMATFCRVTKRGLFKTKRNILMAMQNGFFQTAMIIGTLGGMIFLPGPVVITIMYSYTILLYLFLVFRREEKIETLTLLAVAVALVGLGFVTGVQNNIPANLSIAGFSLAVMAALAKTSSTYLYGKLLKSEDPAVIGAETFIFALFFSCFIMLHTLPAPPESQGGWLWSGLAALSLSLGNFGMFYGIALLGSFHFSFFMKLEPVFGAILSIFLIGEILSLSQYMGMALVVGSLYLYQFLQMRKSKKA